MSYVVGNHAGKPEVQATVALSSNESTLALTSHVDETDADPITAMDLGTVARMTVNLHDEAGSRVEETRTYFLIPGSGAGSDGTNYDATTFAYDNFGRRWRIKEATGTIRRVVYDAIGRVGEEWLGTNDQSFPGGESSGSSNMVKVNSVQYDGGASGGNSHITTQTSFVQDSATDQRQVSITNNVWGQPVVIVRPQAPHELHKYDNRGRKLASALYSSSSGLSLSSDPVTLATNRLSLSQASYDERGRTWKVQRHKVDLGDGSDDDDLQTLRWFDAAGRLMKEDGEQLVKTAYDRLGRVTKRFVLASDNDSGYSDADDVSGDIVLEEMQTVYDVAEDTAVLSVSIARLHDDVGGSQTTGALDTNADNDDLMVTAANLKGRAHIEAFWHDRFGRPTDSAIYGTNNGADFDRDGLGVPARSSTILVTSHLYDTDGTLQQTTDPRGLKSHQIHDAMGRATASIANYIDGTPSGSPAPTTCVDDNITRNVYTDGLLSKTWVDFDGDGNEDSDDQVTVYTYGTTKGTGAGDSKIATGHLLQKVQYPDSSGGTDVVTYAYSGQGEVYWTKDQGGNVIETDHDTGGRRTHLKVTTLASGFDGAVKRISTEYDSFSRVSRIVQYDNATPGSGTVVNCVAYTYDDWGNIAKIEQDRDSLVAPGGNDHEVSFAYAKATAGRNALRRDTATLPTGATVTYGYSSAYNDDNASRLSYMNLGLVRAVEYRYLGLESLVSVDHSEPDIMSRVHGSTSGSYPDLDRFDRITTNRWTKDLSTDRDFHKVDMTYDENSNVLRVEDQVRVSGSTGRFDVLYTVDGRDRLTRAAQGDWNGSTIAALRREDNWQDTVEGGLDQVGNWVRWKLDRDGDGNYTGGDDLDEERTHSKANELAGRDTDHSGTDNHTLAYDAVGNMTDDGKSYKYEYDAFGRLMRLRNRSTNALVTEYAYYGNHHRAGEKYDTDTDGDVDSNDLTYWFAYDDAWRLVAVYRGADTSPKEQFLHHDAGFGGLRGASLPDDVILRDRDANTAWTSASDGTLEERRYHCHNWRGDVVALVTDTGAQSEEARYAPYGDAFGMHAGDVDDDGDVDVNDRSQVQTWINTSAYDVRGDMDRDGDVDAADRTAVSNNAGRSLGWGLLSHSSVGNRRGYAGYEADMVRAGTMHVRFRVYDAELGRWSRRDPLGYVDSSSLYAYAGSAPVVTIDPFGLISTPLGPTAPSATDSAGPSGPIAPPGSGLQLGKITCPGFGGQMTIQPPGVPPPGIQPLMDDEWHTPPPSLFGSKHRGRFAPTSHPTFDDDAGYLLASDAQFLGLGLTRTAGAMPICGRAAAAAAAAGAAAPPVLIAAGVIANVVVFSDLAIQLLARRDYANPFKLERRKEKPCKCYCMEVDERGTKHGPYPVDTMPLESCRSLPQRNPSYSYCFCK